MNLNYCTTFLFTALIFTMGSAQDVVQKIDSTSINWLNEVVVTGQLNKKSIDRSVFEVKVITQEMIQKMAGNTLADILNQSLNITIQPNASTGKSTVQLFGLDGQYFKILIDNIPLINDEGLGNNTDLTQINLDAIEQVEIVEGSMGVQYGANAVSGVINIITKKNAAHTWEITPYVQEETIGDEYDFFDRGRHIQSLSVGHNLSNSWYVNAGVTRNDFTGYLNGKQGEYYNQNDGNRGYAWLPKQQLTGKALIRFNAKNFQAFYRFEIFNEEVERYDSIVRENYNASTQTSNPTATDEIFNSNRLYHHLNASGRLLNRLNYDISLSHQQQRRNIEQYNYRIDSREKFDVVEQEYESRKGLYSRGTITNFTNLKAVDFQLGYELSNINGYASPLAGTFDGKPIDRRLESYDFFTSAEITLGKKFAFRPGSRVLFSSQFKPQAAFSLSSRYLFNNGYQLRAVVGSAPRNPNYDELFTYFVDVNHDLRGNSSLRPEKGFSTFLNLKKQFWANSDATQINSKLSAWYLNVDDRIEVTVVNNSPLAYQYNNIDQFKTWGTSFTNTITHKNLQLNLGFSFSGQSKVLLSDQNFNDDYLYAIQLNTNLSYTLPKISTIISLYYKYNGPQYQFQLDTQGDESNFVRTKQDGYGWLDTSIKKSFLQHKLQCTLGARNLLDVTRVNTQTVANQGVHASANQGLLLGYGRSYFIKLLYNLNF
ncbi:TonB-dependent receptor plug domain-containing protein [Maribacter sp. X9]|uniref:TonB-dependent receptor plug domain-containing protein n=1 Tax=Maribacter sp. X9 TaxID=3402159 RepID=UPI003AF3F2BF